MNAWLNKYISRWKDQEYKLDAKIPPRYLFRLLLTRSLMLLRGNLSGIKNEGLLFFSWKATVKCRSRLSVGRSVTIERGSYVDALSSEGIRFGNNVSVGMNTRIIGTGNFQLLGKGMRTGNNVGLGTGCFYGCGGGIDIGDDTIIGDFVSFHAENHSYENTGVPIRLQAVNRSGIKVGRNCWIGAKATILDGAVIEDGCVIAAGTVVTSGIYSGNAVYGGVPAKLIKKRADNNQ